MINNTTMARDNMRSNKTYASLLNQGQAQDYALHRHIRARFFSCLLSTWVQTLTTAGFCHYVLATTY